MKMNRRKLNGRRIFLLLVIGCLFSTSIFAQIDMNTPNDYSDAMLILGVRFIPPEGWQEVEAPYGSSDGIGIFLTHPQKKAVINVVWNKHLGADEDSFRAGLIEYRDTVKRVHEFVSEEEITFCGVPCYIFNMETNLMTRKGVIKHKFKDYVFFKNGKGYSITYTGYAEEFDKHLPVFEKMLDTFEIGD